MYFICPPHLTFASALSKETGNPEIATFLWNAACFLTKNTQNTLKYHLVTAEPPFAVKMIEWVHQTGPRKHSILLSVTHMLYVNQVCHGVSHCVKYGVKVNGQHKWDILLSQEMLDAIRHITDDNFSFMKTALCVQQSPTAAALSTNTAFEWKMWFSCYLVFPYCQVMQKHKLFEVA